MPLFKEWNPDLHSLAAIWRIDEPEHFFATQINIQSTIKSDKRRIEHLAGRFLLQYLKNDFPLHSITPDEHDKPQLPDGSYHFSVSHSYPYVAAIVNTHSAVGIDLQCWHDRILHLQHKFLSEQEQLFCQDDPHKITLAWSTKEAAYKYQGRRGVDFIEHLPIEQWQEKDGIFDILINLKLTSPVQPLNLKGYIYRGFSLSVCLG